MAKKIFTHKDKEELVERRNKELLPHLYGFKFYSWAKKFFDSTNKFNFLVAANQVGKSTIQIQKALHWATEKSLWKTIWPNMNRCPLFIYLYPTKTVSTVEFNQKWIPELMPRGVMKDDPVYGWEAEYKNKEIWAIHFKSSAVLFFKSYAQDVSDLQTITAHSIFADEEVPEDLFHELRTRLTSTNGVWNAAFTATIGADIWRRTMEPKSNSEELFPNAFKINASLYDCLIYADGTNSHWTVERIKEIEASCSSEAEIQKRVYGRFVVSSGLRFPGFERSRNLVPKQKIDPSWSVYTGTDIGGGGEKGHPASIVMLAVRPDGKYGIVFRGWRGDGIETASNDIIKKHQELCLDEVVASDGEVKKVPIFPVIKSYDWNARDFFIVSSRASEGFTPADKRRDAGAGMMNTLLKLGMLVIMDGDPELQKLVVELTSLQEGTPKQQAKDDLCDALRYCLMPVPWNFEGVAGEFFKVEEKNTDERSAAKKKYDAREPGVLPGDEETQKIDDELDFWAGQLEGG